MTRYILIIVLCFLFSCGSKDTPPKGYIQPKEMQTVLWDVIRAQYVASEMAKHDSTINTKEQTKILSDKALAIHQLSEEDFNKSYQWYVEHPKILQTIFDSLQIQKQREIKEAAEQEKNPTLLERPIKIRRLKNK